VTKADCKLPAACLCDENPMTFAIFRDTIKWTSGVNFYIWRDCPQWVRASSTRFLYHIKQRATFGKTPLGEWSASRRDLYLTTHNTHNRQTSMPRWDSNPQPHQAGSCWPMHMQILEWHRETCYCFSALTLYKISIQDNLSITLISVIKSDSAI
jgi:hypothetical protein